jgi:nitroimidazol reductase NimA-like FMN-containing flavoprotein (pyridoxamine 5'-phosphate oxidase superfamily)
VEQDEKTDKAMTSQEEIEAFFGEAMACRIVLCNKDEPYVYLSASGDEHDRISLHSQSGKRRWI